MNEMENAVRNFKADLIKQKKESTNSKVVEFFQRGKKKNE